MPRPPRPVMMIDGLKHWLCPKCKEWKPRGGFAGQTPIPPSWCKKCMAEKARLKYHEDPVAAAKHARKKQAKRRARVRRQEAKADKVYGTEGRVMVPLGPVKAWVELLVALHGTQEAVSELSGVQVRVLSRIMAEDAQSVVLETADALATLALRQDELAELLGAPGVEGWSRDHRHCKMCGTSVHPHYAKGFCRQCYFIDYYSGPVAKLPRDVSTGWAPRHTCCADCKGTERPHKGRGLCTRCFEQHRRKGSLEQFEAVMPALAAYHAARRDAPERRLPVV